MAVKLNQHDLQFILDQIKIAEAHVAGTPLDQLIAQPHLPYGLRTVDGTYNNLIEGRETWGASDQIMPRMMQAYYLNEGDDSFHGVVTNNDYGVIGTPTQDPDGDGPARAPNGGHTGSVVDADPRIISNLIADQTLRNPAAIAAALQFAEYDGNLMTAVGAIRGQYLAYLDVAGVAAQAAIEAISTDPNDLPTAAEKKAAVAAALEAPEVAGIRDALHATLLDDYGIEMDGNSISLPNVAPDEGLSAPFNGWMAFFGQFFDHGLDLIHKGDNGTIYMPLTADDPLVTHGPDGIPNSGDEVNVNMPLVLTRMTPVAGPGADGVMGTADDTVGEARNKTTPFIDQNQTYTSHPSHQVFLREYAMIEGKPIATGRLLNGADGGLATWKDVKDQAREKLGIELDDRDVFGVPLLLTDPYGEFIRDENGFPQVVVNIGPDLIPNTADDVTASGTLDNPILLASLNGGLGPVRTSHAFLDDIAHNAVPILVPGSAGQPAILMPDPNSGTDPIGDPVQPDPTGQPLYDNELLDKHFITGDGRGNENIGLTAVHHVFHAEHNRQVEDVKKSILEFAASGAADLAFLNEWLAVDVTAMPTTLADIAALQWDGERLFQTARFATEMQYQHLVFEEFGRKVQPLIDVFVFNTVTDVNPAIFAEFAHTVYRFGHSMLTDHLKLLPLNEDGLPVTYDDAGNEIVLDTVADWGVDVGLIDAFLNPTLFDRDGSISAEQAAGAIFRGMSYVRGNEIDEFVVDNLRNNLLGLPLDLPAINLARGRDAGVPSLNDARAELYAASNSSWLKPYESWADFGANLKTPASVINFIAAYGAHPLILAAASMEAKRDAAMLLVFGGDGAPGDRLDFLNSTGAWSAANSGLNTVDLWIGGLAEKIMPFGGMLGSTFNAVFELQMENLQEGDRFYYLSRTQGLNLLNELENNAFTKMIAANTDMTQPGEDGILGTADDVVDFHVGVDAFARHDLVLEVDESKQINLDPTGDDPFMNAIRAKVQRDDPTTTEVEQNYLRFTGGEHAVMGGTANDDTIIGGDGDDAIWGDAGNDRIEGGHGVDLIIGGSGDDIITDSGDTGDFIKGEDGDDVIANSNGLDVLMGGDGSDVFLVGADATEVFGDEGNDFILGGADHDFIRGGEGDDWMEGGDGFDVLNGDNSELFFNSTILGHDVAFAGANENDFDMESGDDIMVQGESVMRNEGMFGFDWAIHKGSAVGANSDMAIPIFTTVFDDILRDRFDQTEALSGWIHDDVLRGDDRGGTEEIEVEFSLADHGLTQAGVNRIDGLRELLGISIEDAPIDPNVDLEEVIAWAEGNILIGGDGNDTFEGRGANDFIHGDAWLNVRLSIRALDDAGNVIEGDEIFTVDSLKDIVTVNGETKSLSAFLLTGEIKPRQLQIVREIKYDEDPSNDTDTAIFAGNRDWYEITHVGDRTYVARRESENIDPQINEGTDTLIGIERIQFADQIYTIRETGNHDPTGRLVINGLPAKEDEPLTVSADNIRDLNNPDGRIDPTKITFRWQIERNDGTGDYIDIPNVSGTSFTPGDEHDGLRVRVLGTYYDAGGVLEIVSSQPTDPVIGVNDEPTGPLLISDMSPTEGQELTATVAFTDPDGMTDAFEEGLLTYQWQFSTDGATGWQDVPAEDGGNGRSFVPGGDLVGMRLRMVVDYFDDLLNEHRVTSGVTQVVGNHIEDNDPVINGTTGGDADGGTNPGDDMVFGGDADNDIDGLAGNDSLTGGGGNDRLTGGDGDDVLDGGLGNDTLTGGEGIDTAIYRNGHGSDTIDLGAGQDRLRIIEGTFGADDSVEVRLNGAGRIDLVNGITTVANVEATDLDVAGGNDTLVYDTAANVTVNLLTGAATGFSMTRGVENVMSGSGNDSLAGNSLDNDLSGGAGNDALRGGFGNDSLSGGEGGDDLRGEAGDDLLEGGGGDDRIDGGAGRDTASYAGAAAAVTVSLLGQAGRASFEEQDTVGAGIDRLIEIENLVGSAYNDTLTGNANANEIDGGAGADSMAGDLGDDTYVVDDAGDQVTEAANEGSDTVRSKLAAYTLGNNVENLVLDEAAGNASGTGNQLSNRFTGNSRDNVFDGLSGTDNDIIVLTGGITDHSFAANSGAFQVTSAAGGTDTLNRIESVEFDGGAVYRFARGTNGTETVNGTAGNDLVLGFNGNDTLNGNGGDDILDGGTGDDLMSGGAGNDTYIVTQQGDRVSEVGGNGVDTILSAITLNLDPSLSAHVTGTVENLTLTGTANINATGTNGANVLIGNSGRNDLWGGAGADILRGGAGNDRLTGQAGNDILEGGDGTDSLNGGGGIDTAVFAGTAGDYAFGRDAAGRLTLTHLVSGDRDTLVGVERMQFDDGQVLDIVEGGGAVPTGPSIIFGSDAGETIVGSNGNDVIVGGAGDDTLHGHDLGDADDDAAVSRFDDDTFIWRPGDGTDTINGGTEGVNGDLFQIVGNAEAETYRIYTYEEAVARIGYAGSDENEIVVTRQVAGQDETVIAELSEIEEIVVNGGGVSGSGQFGGDAVEMYGSFDVATSLRPDTVTILGSSGNDTVNITSLLSEHRIVFKGAGGNDTIIGTLRPQDVVELMPGKTIEDYATTVNADGSTTISTEGHSVTFRSAEGLPQFGPEAAGEATGDSPQPTTGGDEATGGDQPAATETPDPATSAGVGTPQADVLMGTAASDTLLAHAGDDSVLGGAGDDVISGGAGNDFLSGEDGRDVIFAGEGADDVLGGAGADMLYGDAGNDRILAGAGDDLVNGGAGNDVVFGGAGDDTFVAEAGDGNDTYWGDDMEGGTGSDTLDMSAILANITADLGSGAGGRGSVTSSQTGTDVLRGVENIVTGSGNDDITASSAVNVIDGGNGDDIFRFRSAADADGDTITGFQAGDRIDLSGIDAHSGVAGNQSFTLVSGAFTGAGQVMVSEEMREDGAYTVLSGRTDGDDDADFQISIKGSHQITEAQFGL